MSATSAYYKLERRLECIRLLYPRISSDFLSPELTPPPVPPLPTPLPFRLCSSTVVPVEEHRCLVGLAFCGVGLSLGDVLRRSVWAGCGRLGWWHSLRWAAPVRSKIAAKNPSAGAAVVFLGGGGLVRFGRWLGSEEALRRVRILVVRKK